MPWCLHLEIMFWWTRIDGIHGATGPWLLWPNLLLHELQRCILPLVNCGVWWSRAYRPYLVMGFPKPSRVYLYPYMLVKYLQALWVLISGRLLTCPDVSYHIESYRHWDCAIPWFCMYVYMWLWVLLPHSWLWICLSWLMWGGESYANLLGWWGTYKLRTNRHTNWSAQCCCCWGALKNEMCWYWNGMLHSCHS